MNNIITESLPAVKDYKVHVLLIPKTEQKFCTARKNTSLYLRQCHNEVVKDGQTAHYGASAARRSHKNITSGVAEKAKCKIETCPDIKTTLHNIHWAYYLVQNLPLRSLLSNWLWRRCKRTMHNQIVSRTIQNISNTSWINELFFNLPELYRITVQKNQGCCNLSRPCVGLWNYPLSLRENACSLESTTWEE